MVYIFSKIQYPFTDYIHTLWTQSTLKNEIQDPILDKNFVHVKKVHLIYYYIFF